MEQMTIFSERLREFMGEKNLNTRTLAFLCGCPQASISAWMRGIMFPKLRNLIKLADYFKCSVDYILGLSENDKTILNEKNLSFNERFTYLMEKNNYPARLLERKCHISSSNASKWKKGDIPKVETLILLSELFNCSIEYLIGRSDII